MEKNFKTHQALQGSLDNQADADLVMQLGDVTNDTSMDLDSGDFDTMDEDMDGSTIPSTFKDKGLAVLKEHDYEDKRSSKLTQEDFLKLLAVFNKAGFHFS